MRNLGISHHEGDLSQLLWPLFKSKVKTVNLPPTVLW